MVKHLCFAHALKALCWDHRKSAMTWFHFTPTLLSFSFPSFTRGNSLSRDTDAPFANFSSCCVFCYTVQAVRRQENRKIWEGTDCPEHVWSEILKFYRITLPAPSSLWIFLCSKWNWLEADSQPIKKTERNEWLKSREKLYTEKLWDFLLSILVSKALLDMWN